MAQPLEYGILQNLFAAHVWLQSGDAAFAEQKFEQARECYKRSLTICQQIGPEGSPQEQQSMLAYAKCLYRIGDTDAAKVLYDKLHAFKSLH